MAEVHGPVRAAQVGEVFSCSVIMAKRQAGVQGPATRPMLSESTGFIEIAKTPVRRFENASSWGRFIVGRMAIVSTRVHIQHFLEG
jgi:hypothetical protein